MKKYSRIFYYLKDYKGKIALYLVFTVFSIVFALISFGMLKPFFDLIFLENRDILEKPVENSILEGFRIKAAELISGYSNIDLLLIICIVLIIAIFLKNLFLYLSVYILNPLKNTIVNKFRSDLYEKILKLPISYFTEKRKGDLISRVTNDVNEVESSVVGVLEGWVRDPLTIVLTLAFLIYMSPQLTIGILIALPFVALILGRISRALKRQSNKAAIKHGETLSILDETLNGLRVIKAFNVENILNKKFNTVNDELLHTKNKISRRRDMASPMSEFLGIMIFVSILYFGGRLVLGGEIDLDASTFFTYLATFYNIINPIKSLSTSFSNLNKGSAAIARIEDVLNTKNTVDENENGIVMNDFKEKIEFKNVQFSYDEFKILEDINLEIKKGKTVALVGSSGAGKSTLADLIPRFHDVTAGEVIIDGENIKNYALKSVRNHMSIVTQEPILFNDTIANNIALGMPDATREQIINAAKVANAHNFIMQKEEGYDTNIGDRGSKLSGGEKQRLTIARAVLNNPPILILDEATSSLDTESEKLVQDAINNMTQNRTSVVIAHRLSTIRNADEIVVLSKGKIVERGSHQQLMQLENGNYRRLVELQELK